MKAKEKKRLLGNVVFLIIVLIVIYLIIFSFHDIKDVFQIIKTIKIKYLYYLFGIVLLHLFVVAMAIAVISTGISSNVKFLDSLNIANTEHLFNAITPFASGGQPIHGYYFMKYGIPAEKTVSILVSNFLVYQATAALFSIVGLSLYLGKIIALIKGQVILILIGFSINILILVSIILLSTVPKSAKLYRFVIRGLGKIKPLKNVMIKAEEKLFEFVKDFQASMKALFKRKRVFLGSVSLRLLDIFVLNSTAVVIFLALGVPLSSSDYFFIIVMSLFAQTFLMWIPTPGAAGAVEWAFTILFVGILDISLIVPSLLLWRFFTYYFPLIMGFISYLVVRKRSVIYENSFTN